MNSHPEEESVDDGYDENGYDRPSKSQVKREMHALLDLGKQLIELSPERLKQLPLAERLYEAIRMAQRTTGREGRRRQVHFVGKLMRDAPADEIRAQLDVWENGSREETAAMHRLETLRDRLLDDDDVLTRLLANNPQADAQQLRAPDPRRPQGTAGQRLAAAGPGTAEKHYRALFQALKSLYP